MANTCFENYKIFFNLNATNTHYISILKPKPICLKRYKIFMNSYDQEYGLLQLCDYKIFD